MPDRSGRSPRGADADGVDVHQLAEAVTSLRRALRASIRTDFLWESLPMAQVELLLALADRAPVRVRELADLLRLAPNTVSGLVTALLDAGMVVRENDPADRRVARIGLSADGARELAAWRAAHERRIGNAVGALEPAQRRHIADAVPSLARLAAVLAEQATSTER